MRTRARSWARAWAKGRLWWAEVAMLTAVYVGYEWVRARMHSEATTALVNARRIQGWEAWAHVDVELWLNRALERVSWLASAADAYYQSTQLVVSLGVLVLLWHFRRAAYGRLRAVLVVVTLTALVTYWLAPTAPPRFALPGAVDTLAAHPVLLVGDSTVTGWVNLYAAMPSLHVAWAVWCALAAEVALTSRARHLAWLYPAATTWVVLATANHYLLDALAGAGIVALAWMLSAVPRLSFSPARSKNRKGVVYAP